MDLLPLELLYNIVQFSQAHDIINLSMVNRKLWIIFGDRDFWLRRLEINYPHHQRVLRWSGYPEFYFNLSLRDKPLFVYTIHYDEIMSIPLNEEVLYFLPDGRIIVRTEKSDYISNIAHTKGTPTPSDNLEIVDGKCVYHRQDNVECSLYCNMRWKPMRVSSSRTFLEFVSAVYGYNRLKYYPIDYLQFIIDYSNHRWINSSLNKDITCQTINDLIWVIKSLRLDEEVKLELLTYLKSLT